jgi:hypothetical protein
VLDIHGRACYVVDVSLQGAKYMIRKDDHEPRSAFVEKREGSFSLEDFGRHDKDEDATTLTLLSLASAALSYRDMLRSGPVASAELEATLTRLRS